QRPRWRCEVVFASEHYAAPLPEYCPAFQALVHPVTILTAHVVPEAPRAVKRADAILAGCERHD
ncbi:MAG TPA: hypothetical protein VKB53_05260, partial [Gammaproteobacteria bacterium]|nr:hypothetical protein [Gammaproteobacteria bacterium]